MKKKIVFTEEQLNALCNIVVTQQYSGERLALQPQHAWIKELLHHEHVEDHYVSGFNPSHLLPLYPWMGKPSSFLDALIMAKNFMMYHWIDWKFKHFLLPCYGIDREIPTYEQILEASYVEMDEEDLLYEYREEPDYDCMCRGANACLQCNPRMFI